LLTQHKNELLKFPWGGHWQMMSNILSFHRYRCHKSHFLGDIISEWTPNVKRKLDQDENNDEHKELYNNKLWAFRCYVTRSLSVFRPLFVCCNLISRLNEEKIERGLILTCERSRYQHHLYRLSSFQVSFYPLLYCKLLYSSK